MRAELGDEAGDDAEEAAFVEVAHADELVEAVGAARRPGSSGFDDDVALRGFELHLKNLRDDDGGGFRLRLAAS